MKQSRMCSYIDVIREAMRYKSKGRVRDCLEMQHITLNSYVLKKRLTIFLSCLFRSTDRSPTGATLSRIQSRELCNGEPVSAHGTALLHSLYEPTDASSNHPHCPIMQYLGQRQRVHDHYGSRGGPLDRKRVHKLASWTASQRLGSLLHHMGFSHWRCSALGQQHRGRGTVHTSGIHYQCWQSVNLGKRSRWISGDLGYGCIRGPNDWRECVGLLAEPRRNQRPDVMWQNPNEGKRTGLGGHASQSVRRSAAGYWRKLLIKVPRFNMRLLWTDCVSVIISLLLVFNIYV